jgi:amidase
MVGQEAVRNAGGPLGHSAKDLDLFMAAYFAQKSWEKDPGVFDMPWRGETDRDEKKGPFCFAIA